MNVSSKLSYSSEDRTERNREESSAKQLGSPLSTVNLEKVPRMVGTGAFIWGALGSIALSAFLQAVGKKETSNFVGQWVPTLLILGLYSKITKQTRTNEEYGEE